MTYERKVQKIGKSLFVSLPKEWTDQVQLERGDKVTEVEHTNGTLTLYPKAKEEHPRQITLNVGVEESTRSLRRSITGAYVDGFDLIKLKASERLTDEQQDAIRDATEALFGLEIIEVTSSSIAIQCLLTKTLPIESTIQKIHDITKAMFSDTISALKDGNPNVAKGVIKRIRDVRRLSLVVHRLLRSLVLFPADRTIDMKPIDSVDYLRVIDKITEISGSVKKVAESTFMQKQAFSNSLLKPLVSTCLKILNLYDLSIQSLMSKDMPLANRVLDEKLETDLDDLWQLLLKAEETTDVSPTAFSCAHRIIDNLNQIHIYTMEIAEIAIDRAEEI